jgi:hypothetical protein
MELVHFTGMQAGYTMGIDKEAREHIVVCIKGTFTISGKDEEPQFANEQLPLVEADTFTGEPGWSAPVYESDYPLRKPRCDVLLNGSAYAPAGNWAKRVTVGLQVGRMAKSFHVVGDRIWQKGSVSIQASEPKPYKSMPITYDRAFGGVDDSYKDPQKLRAFLANPVGVGYHHHLQAEFVDGKPLPNTEEISKPIIIPNGNYRPMSFGPIGRGWQPRIPLAGTYDQNWVDNIFPFLPPDFDERYHQAAPFDQQIDHPKGGERVFLTNLTPEGRTIFRLPTKRFLVWFFMKDGEEKETESVIDTIMIEPDEKRFMVTWRTSLPLRRNIFEVEQAVIGEHPEDRYQQREENESLLPLTVAADEGVTQEDEEA